GSDGLFAIATGLMGLDCGHSCASELHPLWALGMNVEPSVDDDVWVFFVRNWGDEGYCGAQQHFIEFPNNRYTFRLPWKQGATSVSIIPQSTVFHAYHVVVQAASAIPVPGTGVLVTFQLDPPREDGSVWDAEVHLQWHQ